MQFNTKAVNKIAQKAKKPNQSPCVSTTVSHDFSEIVEDNIENLNLNPIPQTHPLSNISSRGNNDYLESKNHITTKSNNYINDGEDVDSIELREEQDKLIISHMNVIKDEAKTLTEEGNLISNVKGLTNDTFPMEEYAFKLNGIIDKKLLQYEELKKKIEEYKRAIKK